MPPFFLSTDQYIYGLVMANYTSGAPVRGNLTLKATVRPIGPIDPNRYNNRNRPRPIDRQNQFYDQNNVNYGNNQYENYPQEPNQQYDYDRFGSYNRPIVEKYFNFNEDLPFWLKQPEYYYEPVPNMKHVSKYYLNIYYDKRM